MNDLSGFASNFPQQQVIHSRSSKLLYPAFPVIYYLYKKMTTEWNSEKLTPFSWPRRIKTDE